MKQFHLLSRLALHLFLLMTALSPFLMADDVPVPELPIPHPPVTPHYSPPVPGVPPEEPLDNTMGFIDRRYCSENDMYTIYGDFGWAWVWLQKALERLPDQTGLYRSIFRNDMSRHDFNKVIDRWTKDIKWTFEGTPAVSR